MTDIIIGTNCPLGHGSMEWLEQFHCYSCKECGCAIFPFTRQKMNEVLTPLDI